MKYIYALPQFLLLNLTKVIFARKYKSAWDYDRLCFELHLCTLSRTSRILFVGVHERSWVYQHVFKFDFCDYSNQYLLKGDRYICKNCLEINEEYDLVILSGVFEYGSDASLFKTILKMKNFRKFLVLDWHSNIERHTWISETNIFKKLNRTFYYYFQI